MNATTHSMFAHSVDMLDLAETVALAGSTLTAVASTMSSAHQIGDGLLGASVAAATSAMHSALGALERFAIATGSPTLSPSAKAPAIADLRALEQFTSLPAGCITIPVTDGCDPHIKWGEFAVVDTNDREPVNGELYGITGTQVYGPVYSVMQLRRMDGMLRADGSRFAGWFIRQLDRSVMTLSDGPMLEDGVCKKLLGRVVGFYAPQIGGAS